MSGKAKHHHFVPQHLIKQFVTADGRVFYFDKAESYLGIQERAPHSIFHRPHLYSKIDDFGQKDPFQESNYGRLENDAAPILRRIVKAAKEGFVPPLTASHRDVVHVFLYEQFRRVPELRQELFSPDMVEELIKSSLRSFQAKVGEISQKELERFEDPDFQAVLKQNASVGVLNSQSLKILSVMRRRGLAVLLAPTNKSFILGSRPVIKMGPIDRSSIEDVREEMWLPIAPRVAIGLGSGAGKQDLIHISTESVRRMNQGIWAQSAEIAAHSDRLLSSLRDGLPQ